MSRYTTGEIAKLCGVSVRTVQYYDSRNILSPSELSEGGRRLYSEADLSVFMKSDASSASIIMNFEKKRRSHIGCTAFLFQNFTQKFAVIIFTKAV